MRSPAHRGPSDPSSDAPAGAADAGEQPVRIVLRPVGTGLPLGFFAFGVGMAVLGGIGIPLFPPEMLHTAALLLLTFVAPLELVAALLAFLARDGLAGTSLGLFGASWVTLGVENLLGQPQTTNPVIALFLISFTVVVALLGVASFRSQRLLGAILTTAAVRGALSGAHELGAPDAVGTAAGVVALAITAVAFYGGLALLLEEGAHHPVLPIGRRGEARSSVEGPLGDQLSSLESDAGVRRRL